MKTVRSYNKIVTELINLTLPYRIEIADYLQYDKIYPFLVLKSASKMATKTVIILSGHHGDEPFAVTTLLKWLRQPILYPQFNYYVFPVCNPFGYEKNCRDNGARQDTNNDVNLVKDSKVKELAILFEQFPQTADMILDIHGDTGKENCYAYEHKAENYNSIAERALMENDLLLPYEKTKTIYHISLHNGVLTPPSYDMGLEAMLEKLGVQYSIALELPGKHDGQKRAAGGVAIINSILRHFVEQK